MNKWEIHLSDKTIKVEGKTLKKAVYNWGQKTRMKTIECGLLVRVKKITKNSLEPWGYWDSNKFMEALD